MSIEGTNDLENRNRCVKSKGGKERERKSEKRESNLKICGGKYRK